MHLQCRNGTAHTLLAQFAVLAEPGLHALFGGVQSQRSRLPSYQEVPEWSGEKYLSTQLAARDGPFVLVNRDLDSEARAGAGVYEVSF